MTYSLCCNLLTFFSPRTQTTISRPLYDDERFFNVFFATPRREYPTTRYRHAWLAGADLVKKKWVFLGNCGRGQINPKGLGQVNHASTNTRVGLGYSLIQSQEVAHFERWAHRRRVLVIRPTISSLTFILAFYTDTPLMFHYTSKQSHGKLFTICIV